MSLKSIGMFGNWLYFRSRCPRRWAAGLLRMRRQIALELVDIDCSWFYCNEAWLRSRWPPSFTSGEWRKEMGHACDGKCAMKNVATAGRLGRLRMVATVRLSGRIANAHGRPDIAFYGGHRPTSRCLYRRGDGPVSFFVRQAV